MARVHKCLLQFRLYKMLFGEVPSIAKAEKRWAAFAILLSIVFAFFALAIGVLTIDTATVSGSIMTAALVLFAMGLLLLFYAIGIGVYWFRPKRPVEEGNQLHEDTHALIKHIDALVQSIDALVRKMGEKDGK